MHRTSLAGPALLPNLPVSSLEEVSGSTSSGLGTCGEGSFHVSVERLSFVAATWREHDSSAGYRRVAWSGSSNHQDGAKSAT